MVRFHRILIVKFFVFQMCTRINTLLELNNSIEQILGMVTNGDGDEALKGELASAAARLKLALSKAAEGLCQLVGYRVRGSRKI